MDDLTPMGAPAHLAGDAKGAKRAVVERRTPILRER